MTAGASTRPAQRLAKNYRAARAPVQKSTSYSAVPGDEVKRGMKGSWMKRAMV
jgi:hypothetical protein